MVLFRYCRGGTVRSCEYNTEKQRYFMNNMCVARFPFHLYRVPWWWWPVLWICISDWLSRIVINCSPLIQNNQLKYRKRHTFLYMVSIKRLHIWSFFFLFSGRRDGGKIEEVGTFGSSSELHCLLHNTKFCLTCHVFILFQTSGDSAVIYSTITHPKPSFNRPDPLYSNTKSVFNWTHCIYLNIVVYIFYI